MNQPTLYHRLMTAPGASPTRSLVLLHGIFGMGRNWTLWARRLLEACPHWAVVLVDLRLHGRSRDFPPPHTIQACMEDVWRLMRSLPLPVRAMMGHSFGGKVALSYGQHHPEALEQVWLLDATPVPHEAASGASIVLEIMRTLPMPQPSRAAVIEALEQAGLSGHISSWLATNVVPRGGQFHWAFDFDGIEGMMRDYFITDLMPVVEAPPEDWTLHCVKAERSGTLSRGARARIEAAGGMHGRAFVHDLPQADHWLHVTNLDGLVALTVGQLSMCG